MKVFCNDTTKMLKGIFVCLIVTLIPFAGSAQGPMVKQKSFSKSDEGGVYKKKNLIKENPPSIPESDYNRIKNRMTSLNDRQKAILTNYSAPTATDSLLKLLKMEYAKNDILIKEQRDSLVKLTDSIEKIKIANYVHYLKSDRSLGAILFPASPIHRATPTETCALYYNSRYKGIRSKAFYSFIYGAESNWGALNSVALQGRGNQASLYAEVGSGLIGPLRIGLSTLVTKEDTIKMNEARQRLMNGGGNLNLEVQFPIFYLHKKWECSYIYASAKTSGDVPAFGTNTEKATGNFNIGLEYYQDISTSNKQFNFFASA